MTRERSLGVSLTRLLAVVTAAYLVTLASLALAAKPVVVGPQTQRVLEQIGLSKGICAVLGLPEAGRPSFVTELTAGSELLVYFQSHSADEVAIVRTAADAAGLLGNRIFVEQGAWQSIHLADNLVDRLLVAPGVRQRVAEEEILRVLRPDGRAILGDRQITKPPPAGIDSWSHPFHGPDNNPQSTDQIARAPYLTQFLAEPMFSPMPEVSVAGGGRVFKAFGHIAHKENQNAILNTLMCINAYNGTILWQRKLSEGFMIHRNTMIATPDALYLGDHESCKVIDAQTGDVRDQIRVPPGISDGPVWKWMAMHDGILYALVGGSEISVDTRRSDTPGLGHWPWGMWQGHDYGDPKTNFGSGRTFLAIDTTSKRVLWTHRESEYLDSRGVCMNNDRIYFYSPEKYLGCLDAHTGDVVWRNSDADLLQAIGPNGRAQHYVTGYATTTYIKCDDNYIFFAGPQRSRLVVASTKDGRLAWSKQHGNLQLVLRDDGLYCAGPETTGAKFAYDTGEELARLPTRRACTRATGSIDSIFYRTTGGTVRLEIAANRANHIAPMRPPCQDGVIISDGLLFWGPWMCGCQLSLYGHISLAPAGTFHDRLSRDESRLEPGEGDSASVARFDVQAGDWPVYLGNNQRTAQTKVAIARQLDQRWTFEASSSALPTAPVAAGGLVFVADRSGVVQAVDAEGKLQWKAFTGGPIYFSPAVAEGRVYVGSADGRIYALEAASGRRLWSFRVAPGKRRIPVYGKLISTWPVAGGVVVQDGTVYAAAGIAHYDGTHVVALDAVTGEPKWHNDSSGSLSQEVNSGISLQGDVYLRDGELRFLAGGIYETARFDLQTGECLNVPWNQVTSQFHTAFYAYYPTYGRYLSLDHTFTDGTTLEYDASYEGSRFSNLALLGPLPAGVREPQKLESRWIRRNPAPGRRNVVWEQKTNRRFTSFVVTPGVLLAAGHTGDEKQTPFLAAINIENGSDLWIKELPSCVVKGGAAVDRHGRIIVALENGQVVCLTGM